MENQRITLFAKSSSGGAPYSVNFVFEQDLLTVHCDCPAGRFGKFCKHKIRMLQEDYDILSDSDDENQCDRLTEISNWIQKSEFLNLIFERSKFKTALREAQEKLDQVKREMRPIEEKMAIAMKKGIRKP